MNRRARLRWQCRRGKLELDIILESFAARELNGMTEAQLDLLERLLAASDETLLAWLTGQETPPDELRALVARLQDSRAR